jgi:hypothetical protein
VAATLSAEEVNAEEEAVDALDPNSDHLHLPVYTLEPTAPPTPAPEAKQLNSFELKDGGGNGYTVGQRFKIGVGAPGWDAPATVAVSAVGADGNVLSLDIVESGIYSGEDGTGDYNLTPEDAALLMKAKQGGQQEKNTPTSVALAGTAAAFLALFAVVVVKRHQVTGAFTPTPDNISMDEMNLTPPSRTILKLQNTNLGDLL